MKYRGRKRLSLRDIQARDTPIAMNDIQTRIRAQVDNFTNNLTDLIQRAALESVNQALKSELKIKSNGHSNGNGRIRGEKRTQEQIAATAEKALAFIAKNPGSTMEQIRHSLGETITDMNLPIKKLLADKRVSKKGQKRGTRYTAK